MTALKPLEALTVRSVRASRYPGNKVCAHPDCDKPTDDFHHCFPRSLIGGQSWFVEIIQDSEDDSRRVIPHVAGLCRPHHDDVEQHRAWIRLEDAEFRWYDHYKEPNPFGPELPPDEVWEYQGPLNPQPGSAEGKPKRKKFKGEARRKRKTISIRVPQDEQEDGAGVWEDLIEQLREKYETPDVPTYYVAIKAFYEALLA